MESTLYVFSFQMVYFLVQPCFLRVLTRGKMAMVQKILGEKRYLQNKHKGKRKKQFFVVGRPHIEESLNEGEGPLLQ